MIPESVKRLEKLFNRFCMRRRIVRSHDLMKYFHQESV